MTESPAAASASVHVTSPALARRALEDALAAGGAGPFTGVPLLAVDLSGTRSSTGTDVFAVAGTTGGSDAESRALAALVRHVPCVIVGVARRGARPIDPPA